MVEVLRTDPSERVIFSGGGAMGALMRNHDWSLSPLGPPETWPPSLQAVVRLMLASEFPMFVAWGPELGFLYNDRYAEILGAKHPAALGARFQDIWSEIWPDIGALVEAALAGEASFRENLPLVMRRRGHDEQTWFTFSYSPVRDEAGDVAGMFCTCTETTGRILAEQQLRHSQAQAGSVLEGMAEGFVLLDHEFRVRSINAEALRIEGRLREAVLGKTHWEAWPGSEESELGRLYKTALSERVPVSLQHRFVWPDHREAWLEMRAYPAAEGLAIFYRDITARKVLDDRQRFLFALGDLIRDLPDPVSVTTAAARQLGAELGAARAGYGEIDWGRGTVSVARDWTDGVVASLAGEARLLDGFGPALIEELSAGRTVVVTDFRADPRAGETFAETWESIDTRALIVAPLVKAGELRAIFYVHEPQPRDWTDAEVALAEATAERTWDAVARADAERRLRESEDHYRHAVELNPQTVWTSGPDGRLDRVGERWREWTGTSGLGESWGEALHPDDLGPTVEAWTRSVSTGATYDVEHRIHMLDGSYRWMRSRAFPRRDEFGRILKWYGTTQDIHEQKGAQAALMENEARLRAITDSIDQLIWSTRPDGYHDYYNQRWYEYTGVPPGSTDGEGWNEIFHPNDQERAFAVWRESLETGEPYHIEYRLRHRSGQYRWVLGRAQPVRDEAGRITRWFGTCTDIQDSKAAEEALRQSRDLLANETQALEILNRTGAQVAAELDLESLVQRVVDAGVQLTGAEFGAFFYNVENQDGESYMLFALSGAEREAFNFGMPRATSVFSPTFLGQGIVRSADIKADPRYGLSAPHHGMPEGHLPVRSYLAVPVVSRSGAVLGGLFFGHAEVDVFDERAERVMVGLAAQAAIGIDNARLYRSVQHANQTLEARVAERTAELERAHEQLRQAQKMEAVGQLTGGIAHDFNNMLAIVIGSLDLLGRRLGGADARTRRYVDAAADGARRAALLTQRLLAFSRQQPLRPEPIDVNKLVAGMSDLIRGSIASDVRFEIVLAAGGWRTHADPNQLENVLLNLAVNARDAMPEGGRLTVETQNTHLDERYTAAHLGVTAGQYVMIAVSDTGAGMTAEVVAKAFDPFFTTKEVGKGTGLGLSQVYGFVKQTGGHVKIYSEPGQGTTVKVYLPRLVTEADRPAHNDGDAALPLGERQEVVLVVEDEEGVREFSADALNELGYRVLQAESAPTALRLLDAHPEITLLFTDVVMPEVNGRKLADEARRRRPDLKVLFTTGYTRNAVVHNGVLDPGVELIGKPFTLDELAAKVRAVLDGPSWTTPPSEQA